MQETQETRVWSPGREDPPKQEMTIYSSILAWKISWTEEPGGLQSMGSQRVRHDWSHMRETPGTLTGKKKKADSKTSPHPTEYHIGFWLSSPPWQNGEQSIPYHHHIMCSKRNWIWERSLETVKSLPSVWHPGSLYRDSETPAKGL